jgi:hypothetical protein
MPGVGEEESEEVSVTPTTDSAKLAVWRRGAYNPNT